MASPCVLEMRGITKEFPGVKALDRVDLRVCPGEIHALVGENGAGKSTLIKVLSGVYPVGTFSGDIVLDGQAHRFRGVPDAEAAGIAVIYQELTLIKGLSIDENLFLGHEPVRRGLIDQQRLSFESQNLLARVRLNLPVGAKVKDLGVGQQQLVEIAKALGKRARILVLDEPTASLTEGETTNLMNILRELRRQGVTCIYISHRIKEIFQIADRVTVLRDGRTVGTAPVSELTEGAVISLMVGRELTDLYPREPHQPGEVLLSTAHLWAEDPSRPGEFLLEDISLEVRAGEILGLSGLMGAGRTELVTSLFGAFRGRVTGEICFRGRPLQIKSPLHAIRSGLGLVTEDRKRYGLVLKMNVMENVTLAGLRQISPLFIDQNEEIKATEALIDSLRIKTPSLESKAGNLSGGNQQKVVLAKWLMTGPQVLFLDEPTRGIDVGAKVELYKIMNELVRQGVGIVMVSSELPEILGMSDRILVMHQGRVAGELSGAEATQEKVMRYATGGR